MASPQGSYVSDLIFLEVEVLQLRGFQFWKVLDRENFVLREVKFCQWGKYWKREGLANIVEVAFFSKLLQRDSSDINPGESSQHFHQVDPKVNVWMILKVQDFLLKRPFDSTVAVKLTFTQETIELVLRFVHHSIVVVHI